jgi:hypothetical protein
MFAGPLYLVVGFAQAFTRPGFDPLHNDLSVLSNGSLGWIQITNLILAGTLTLLFSIGVWRAAHGGLGGTSGPILLGVFALGLVGAGAFIADPMNGFPPGTPPGYAISPTIHGFLHFITAGVGFLCFIAACFVLSRRFFASRLRGFGWFSVATGLLFFLAFAGIASGLTSASVVLAFTFAVVLAWVWIAVVSARLHRAV